MKRLLLLLITGLGWSLSSFAQYNYTPTKTVDSKDIYWGVTIPDPYRWLENLKDPAVESWFKAQADYTNSILNKIPGQDKLIRELEALDHLTPFQYSDIKKVGGRYFYRKKNSGEEVPKIYYKDIRPKRKWHCLTR